jgi:hypothetical protein
MSSNEVKHAVGCNYRGEQPTLAELREIKQREIEHWGLENKQPAPAPALKLWAIHSLACGRCHKVFVPGSLSQKHGSRMCDDCAYIHYCLKFPAASKRRRLGK